MDIIGPVHCLMSKNFCTNIFEIADDLSMADRIPKNDFGSCALERQVWKKAFFVWNKGNLYG